MQMMFLKEMISIKQVHQKSAIFVTVDIFLIKILIKFQTLHAMVYY